MCPCVCCFVVVVVVVVVGGLVIIIVDDDVDDVVVVAVVVNIVVLCGGVFTRSAFFINKQVRYSILISRDLKCENILIDREDNIKVTG